MAQIIILYSDGIFFGDFHTESTFCLRQIAFRSKKMPLLCHGNSPWKRRKRKQKKKTNVELHEQMQIMAF